MKSAVLTNRTIFYINIILSILLFVVILLFARDIISHSFTRGDKAVINTQESSDKTDSQSELQLTDYSKILKNNPFGFLGGEIRSLASSGSANIQQGDVVLIGTVVGPKKLSYAIFRRSSGIQEMFKAGENVSGLGELYMVKTDRVLIRQDGKITEVNFEDLKIREVRKQIPPNSLFAKQVGKGTYIVDQRNLQQMIANPSKMMTDARLKPNVVNGKEEGFILSEVKPGGIYHSLGLQNGDVLLRINEYDISNPERALQAFSALKGLDRVQVDLIRSGAKMTMTYQIQ
ncbi:MAG: PDZ domain-containing protein [Nitrospirae bacterium]|nr:PDZ domain-containing protein [Nitrospirota bacterium]